MELGIYSFIETPASGSPAQRLQHFLEEGVLADELGLDVIGVGEHHRPDFVASAPAIVLAALAVKTRRARLTSAVTVLSSDDPVRVFQEFATVDLLSGGRAEIMAGRGSFIESFPLFGYDLADYDELFAEKLQLLLAIRESERISWSGRHRPPIDQRGVYPRPVQHPLPVWVAVGGTRESIMRAATLHLPMALAIIGGAPAQFVPHVQLFRRIAAQEGHPELPVSINSHVFVADDSQDAADAFYPGYADAMTRIGRDRGWPPMNRQHFEQSRTAHGALMVGSPQQVIDKILYEHELFGHSRFMAQMTVGSVPHDKVMRSVELFGNVVAPAVRKALAGTTAAAGSVERE
jgi:probable LLM family oxidoreductase